MTEAQETVVARRAAGIATEIVEHPDKPGWFALAASDERAASGASGSESP